MARTVTTIPATRQLYTGAKLNQPTMRKVAGYARVSTDHEDQATSYEAQVDYYTNYINNRSDWQLVKIYTDEGISGTSTKRRQGFKQMINDALLGKIDLIITKSVSRFARNTVDALTYIRKLKEKGVEIYFEKENIYSLDSKGELMLTIMSSLAQEEARSISENVTWGHRKRFADGKAIIPYSSILGYKRGENDTLVIDEEQAPTVKRIYELFLQGYALPRICKILSQEGHKTVRGLSKWSATSVRSILSNEKYRGDLLIQKTVVVNFLTKEHKVNEGEAPQYYISQNHEAIIPPPVWDQVQYELNYRYPKRKSKVDQYAGCLRCAYCGSLFGKKQVHPNTKYQGELWRCNHKYDGDDTCKSKVLKREMLEKAFANVVLRLKTELANHDDLFADELRNTLINNEDKKALKHITKQLESIQPKLDDLACKLSGSHSQTTEKANDRYIKLYSQYEALLNEQSVLQTKINEQQIRFNAVNHAFTLFKTGEAEKLFNHSLWHLLVDEVIVSENELEFILQNGMHFIEKV